MDEHEDAFSRDPDAIRAKVSKELVSKGFSEEDSRELVAIISQPAHKDFFIEYVMSEHENEELPGDAWGPLKDGAVTFISFLIFGSIAMWVYVICNGVKYKNAGGTLGISAAATFAALFILGVIQGHVSKVNRFQSGMTLAINGSLACAAAYGVSYGIMSIIGTGGEAVC